MTLNTIKWSAIEAVGHTNKIITGQLSQTIVPAVAHVNLIIFYTEMNICTVSSLANMEK